MGVPSVDDAVTGHPFSLGVLPSQLAGQAAPAVASALMQQDGDTMAQLPAAHTPLLQSIMQRELQALSPESRQLQLARCIQAQHAPSTATAEPPGCGHTRVQVVPLLGMCLMHLVSDQRLQGASAGPHSSSTHSAAAAANGGQVTPAELFASMLQVSPFLGALESELRSLHTGAASCYRNIKQQLAAVGQHLPPAAADESGRRSSTASSPDGAPLDSSRGRGIGSDSSSTFYGQGLDLHQLHQDADSAALDLVSLEDCISSNVASLAQLAQQYDVMITAALAAAADHADPAGAPTQQQQQGQRVSAAPAALAPAAGGRKGGFLQSLLGAVLGRQAGSARQESGAVEYVFMSHGVCSHSNKAQLHSFHAGVPPDVYSSCIHKLLFHSSSSEHVLWMLSVINARLRYAADTAAAAGADRSLHGAGHAKQWTAPDKFTRSTTKYWVHPSNLLRLKLALTKQLPLLVYGADDPVSSGDIAAAAAEGADGAPASQQHKVTSLVSSVYFDGPELDVYHTRLARVDGARLVRVRYYGQRLTGEAGEQQTVFVEQKTHRDKTLGETSYKERASLQQSQLPAFLSGQVALEEVLGPNSKKLELMRQVQQSLIEAQQAPVMRSEYLRSAWQAYDNNEVRFSLDEHMLLLREAAPASPGSSSSSSSWCSPLESLEHLPACDAVRFPYAILEVKLQDKQAAPAWVHELQTSGVLVEVPKFSKFLHGMALLQPEKIRELPSWFVWREGERVTLPATLDEVWDMMAERLAQKELEWQDLQDPSAAAAAAPSPDAAAMLVLLRAPRGYASTAFDCLSHPADAASKLGLASAASFDLTATAATAPAPHPAAASGAAEALDVPSYPCHAIRRSATNSSNSHGTNTSTSSPGAVLLHGPARSIMQDGQFGCAGADSSSVPGGWHRGSGGGMQPLLGLVALPGRRDSWSCVRGAAQHMEGTAELGAASPSCLEEVNGGSPAFGAHPLTVRVPPAHTRSLSSSSLGSSDLHGTNSSSSMGPAAAEAALPHFTACSSSPSCCHSPLRPAYPRVDHTDYGREPAHDPQDAVRRAGAGRRPNSRGSSSGSWKLATTNPLFGSGPLDHASLTAAAAAAPAGAWCAESDRDAALRVGDNNSSGISSGNAPWGARGALPLKTPASADAAALGAIKGGDVVLDLSRLTPQAAAVAAGAGRQQVIQVHYTGAVQAVPVNASPAPSPRQVRELSLLLPTVAGGTAAAPELAAADAAELGAKEEDDGMASCNGVAVGRTGAAAGRGQGKGSRGYRQRMQQWRAALGSRMKGLRGGKVKAAGAGVASTNDHMLGYGGAAPRQPTFVKPRADPKTFFANERTFLQWLQISVLVMMTGLGMLTGSTLALASGDTCMSNALCSASRISGAIISPVSILFMVYAIYLYRKRTRQLLRRSTLRYDDQCGPWVLTITLIAVTLIVIVLALQGFRTAGGRP